MNRHSIHLLFRNRPLLAAVALWILACSCAEDVPEPLFTTSVIQGRIYFYYASSENVPEGISITTRGPYDQKTAFTNSDGDYQISGLGNGTYELEIAKESFGTKYHYGIQLFGDDTVHMNDELYECMTGARLPELYEVHTRDSYSWLNETTIAITTGWKQGEIYARVFMADNDDVSYRKYRCTRKGIRLKRTGFENLLLLVEDLPFESGKEIFLIAYTCNPEEEGYINTYTGVWTFSTLDPEEHSKVMRFTMP
jgi:hypothetical protein